MTFSLTNTLTGTKKRLRGLRKQALRLLNADYRLLLFAMQTTTHTRSKPFINVTPLIDVLLVMLIIFMVASPLKPHSFAAKLPQKSDQRAEIPDIRTLVVSVLPDHRLRLNALPDDMGTIEDSSKLSAFLLDLFNQRRANHVYRDDMRTRTDLPEWTRIEKTVFIKAPRSLSYGNVAKVIDGVKGGGANPVGLQLDDLMQ